MQLLADCALEQIMNTLKGNDDIKKAFMWLDSHTVDESLMVGMKTLEATYRVEDVVRDVDGNLRATRFLVEGIGGSVKKIEGVTHYGMQQCLSIFLPRPLSCNLVFCNNSIDAGAQTFVIPTPHHRSIFDPQG